jgi:hypothetical protein
MSVRFFMLGFPADSPYAWAGCRGTWPQRPTGCPCPECSAVDLRRLDPLIIEWEPGSDQIGDFTWPSFGLVVTQRVREAFEGKFRGFEFGSVEMRQDPKVKRPVRVTKRTVPRVWLPYEGPTLWDLRAPKVCGLDLSRSNLTIRRICGTCSRIYYDHPHDIYRRYTVDRSTWNGEHAFQLRESPVLHVTEEVKQLIETQGFTNVRFWDSGEILD